MIVSWDFFLLLQIMLICWFVSKFEPLIWLIDSYTMSNPILQLLWENLTCPKCISFWPTLAITFDPFQAITVSICTSLFHKMT